MEDTVTPRLGIRGFLRLERTDFIWLVVLLAIAGFVRFASPITVPLLEKSSSHTVANGLGYPYNSTGCIDDVPVGKDGAPEKHCGFVFDEVYFPVDAAKDLHNPPIDYFDPEPPLAKLLMAPAIATLGFGSWAWRLVPALAGTLFIALIYLIALRLRPKDRFFAVSASLFVALDGLALVESRTGVIDSVAVFFVALFYYLFLLHWQSRTKLQWRVTLYLMAVGAGLAFAAKLTAIAPTIIIVALVGFRLAEPLIEKQTSKFKRWQGNGSGDAEIWRDVAGSKVLLHYGAAVLLAILIFGLCFTRYLTIQHTVYRFTSCTQSSGPSGYSTVEPLVEQSGFNKLPYPINDLVNDVANINDATSAGLQYHYQECRGHPYQSRWYSWPVMYHPVLFYASSSSSNATPATTSTISNMGNPVLWWLSISALLWCAWRMTAGRLTFRATTLALGIISLALMILSFHAAESSPTTTIRVTPSRLFDIGLLGMGIFCAIAVSMAVFKRRFVPAFIVLGYLVAWLMWTVGNERRILFFYHMLGTLPFLAMGLAYALTAIRRVKFSLGRHEVSLAPIAYGIVGLVVVTFIFFYPIWTATTLSVPDHALRTWLDSW